MDIHKLAHRIQTEFAVMSYLVDGTHDINNQTTNKLPLASRTPYHKTAEAVNMTEVDTGVLKLI